MRVLLNDDKTYTVNEKKTTIKKISLKNTDKTIKAENIIKVIYYDENTEKELFDKIFKEEKENIVIEKEDKTESNC